MPRGNLEAEILLPRLLLDVSTPCLGLVSALRLVIAIWGAFSIPGLVITNPKIPSLPINLVLQACSM